MESVQSATNASLQVFYSFSKIGYELKTALPKTLEKAFLLNFQSKELNKQTNASLCHMAYHLIPD